MTQHEPLIHHRELGDALTKAGITFEYEHGVITYWRNGQRWQVFSAYSSVGGREQYFRVSDFAFLPEAE